MFDQLLDFVKLSRLTVSTARRVLTAQITGAGDAGDDATAETLSAVEVVQPLGLLAYPTLGATTEALIARIGDTAVALGLVDKGGAAQAVEAGEVRLYGPGSQNATATIRIRADGSIEITSTSNQNITVTAAGTGEVRVNGVRFPKTMTNSTKLPNGQTRTYTVTFDKITVNEPSAPSRFAVPPLSTK